MDRYNKYLTKQYKHTQKMVVSTWLGDHQEKSPAPTNGLYMLHIGCYQVLLTYLPEPVILTDSPAGSGPI